MTDSAVKTMSLKKDKRQGSKFLKRLNKDKFLLLMFLPTFLFFFIFKYIPIWGVVISFMDFKPFLGFAKSSFVGLKHYQAFFSSPDAIIIIKNTLFLGVSTLLWGFPLPIIFALILNEVRNMKFKKLVQTVSYMPHFISHVVVVGMMFAFLSPIRGPINMLIESLGGAKIDFMSVPEYFRTLYVTSDLWQQLGWGAIIYLAALSGIDPQLYEAAEIDGAGKFRQIISITIPSIAPTIITMLLLRSGVIFNVGFEKVLLMYSPVIYDTADVISTYAYRQGLVSGNISYATAIGLFNSLLNLTLLLITNFTAKKMTETSLW